MTGRTGTEEGKTGGDVYPELDIGKEGTVEVQRNHGSILCLLYMLNTMPHIPDSVTLSLSNLSFMPCYVCLIILSFPEASQHEESALKEVRNNWRRLNIL